LSLLFLSSPDSDLKTLGRLKPDWMGDHGIPNLGATDFHEQLMDAVAEMTNVSIGLYSQAIYNMCALNTHHSIPKLVRNPGPSSIQEVFTSLEILDQLLLVIENEFLFEDRPIHLWCVISL